MITNFLIISIMDGISITIMIVVSIVTFLIISDYAALMFRAFKIKSDGIKTWFVCVVYFFK